MIVNFPLIYGRKRADKRLGIVADVCMVCHDIRAFDLFRVATVYHLYYLPVSARTYQGHLKTCRTCKSAVGAIDTDYVGCLRQFSSIEQLTAETFPKLREVRAEQRRRAALFRENSKPLTPEDRISMLRSAILAVSPSVHKYFARTRLCVGFGIGALVALEMLVSNNRVGARIAPGYGNQLLFCAFVLAFIVLLFSVIAVGRRHMRNKVGREITNRMATWRPSHGELAHVIGEVNQAGNIMGRKLKPEDVLAHFRCAPES